jgi:YD repeat-containing protein
MKPIKGVQECAHQLQELEQVIFKSLMHQLTRIGRPVDVEELDFIPFSDQVSDYIESISLEQRDKWTIPVVRTSFADIHIKDLKSFLYDGEMSHQDLLDLLELLTHLSDPAGKPGSFLKPIQGVAISYHKSDRDQWKCICGNHPESDGFYTCDRDGNLIEATTDSWWDELYRCDRCGRVIDQRTHVVLGINENPEQECPEDWE